MFFVFDCTAPEGYAFSTRFKVVAVVMKTPVGVRSAGQASFSTICWRPKRRGRC